MLSRRNELGTQHASKSALLRYRIIRRRSMLSDRSPQGRRDDLRSPRDGSEHAGNLQSPKSPGHFHRRSALFQPSFT